MCELINTKRKRSSNTLLFSLLILILLLHILRNISTLLYLTIFLLFVVLICFNCFNARCKLLKYEGLFLVMYSLLPVVTILNGYSFAESFESIGRYLIMYLFFIVILIYRRRLPENYIYFFYKLYCLYISISAITIVYQVFFGPITFFADSSYREGLVRFSSLCGSLTVFGTASSFSLIVLIFVKNKTFSKKFRIVNILITVLGMVCSLQKAAVINLLLIIVFVLLYSIIYLKKKLLIGFGLAIVGVLVAFPILKYTSLWSYVDATISYAFNQDIGSYSTINDLTARLFSMPLEAYRSNDMHFWNLFIGKGLPMYAGTVGLPDTYVMCHNNFATMLFAGGIVYLVAFLCILLNKLKRNYNIMHIFIILFYLLNMLIGAGEFFQPVMGVFMFMFLFVDKNKSQKKRKVLKIKSSKHKNAAIVPLGSAL